MVHDAELRAAIAAIAAQHPDADVVRRGVREAYAEDQPGGGSKGGRRVVHLEPERDRLEAGDVYVTWVVTFVNGEVVEVDRFVSRACRAR